MSGYMPNRNCFKCVSVTRQLHGNILLTVYIPINIMGTAIPTFREFKETEVRQKYYNNNRSEIH